MKMLLKTRWLLGCALLATLAGPVGAQSAAPVAQPVPLEHFFALPQMERPVLSPSGRYLAFLRGGNEGHNLLVLVDLQDFQRSRALAGYSDADIFGVRWVGDDHLVYSLTDLQSGSGEINFAPGLFTVPREGGQPRQLIKTNQAWVVDGSFSGSDRRLSPNHRLLFVPQGSTREVIVGQYARGPGELPVVYPLRLNIETLLTEVVRTGAPSDVNHWLFDAEGQPRLAVQEAKGRSLVHWRAPGSTAWTQILDADRLRMPWSPYALDAAGSLFVTQSRGPEGFQALFRFDFERGAPAAAPTVEVPGFDFRGGLVGEREGGRTLGVRAVTDGEITVWLDPAMKALQKSIDERLPGRVNRLSCRRCDSDERVVLVESWSDRDPGSTFIWNNAKQQLVLLGRALPAIDPRRMATLDFHRTKARDGRDLPVWLTLPRREPGSPPPPVVVLVHGGPMVRGSVWGWHGMQQFLASRGYAVVEPEFRGSAGYGAAHLRAGWKQWGQAMQDDIADSLRWAAAQGHVDGNRACIMGGSYGGYATLMGLVRHPDLYRCGIASAAVTDLMRFVEGSWWWADDIADEGRRYDLPAMVGDPKTDAEMLRANSPVLQAARIKAPVLLVHGERDRRVPVVHARDMRAALRAAGQEPEWLTFGEEGHGWQKVENRQAFARRVEAFLARHLRAAPDQGVPMNK